MNYFAFPGLEDEIVHRVISYVAIDYGTTSAEVRGKSHVGNIKEARHVSAWLLYTCTSMSYESVGNAFRRDHSSMIYAVKKVKRLSGFEENLKIFLKGAIKDLNLTYSKMKTDTLTI